MVAYQATQVAQPSISPAKFGHPIVQPTFGRPIAGGLPTYVWSPNPLFGAVTRPSNSSCPTSCLPNQVWSPNLMYKTLKPVIFSHFSNEILKVFCRERFSTSQYVHTPHLPSPPIYFLGMYFTCCYFFCNVFGCKSYFSCQGFRKCLGFCLIIDYCSLIIDY